MERGGFVYILTNSSHSTLYIGVTSDLAARIWEHKEKVHPNSFTACYQLNKLVYFEAHSSISESIEREKQLKGGSRNRLQNPFWNDLYETLD